jgi:hypothetical protein
MAGQSSKAKKGQSSGGISKNTSNSGKDVKAVMEEARAQQLKMQELNNPNAMETEQVERERIKEEMAEDLFVQNTNPAQVPVSLWIVLVNNF